MEKLVVVSFLCLVNLVKQVFMACWLGVIIRVAGIALVVVVVVIGVRLQRDSIINVHISTSKRHALIGHLWHRPGRHWEVSCRHCTILSSAEETMLLICISSHSIT